MLYSNGEEGKVSSSRPLKVWAGNRRGMAVGPAGPLAETIPVGELLVPGGGLTSANGHGSSVSRVSQALLIVRQ
jgi:hypothetical protein